MAKTKKTYRRIRNILLYSIVFSFAAYIVSAVPGLFGKSEYSAHAPFVNKASADSPHYGSDSIGDAPDGGDGCGPDGDGCW